MSAILLGKTVETAAAIGFGGSGLSRPAGETSFIRRMQAL